MRKTETVRMKIEFVENTQPGWSRSSVLYYISVLADGDLAAVWQFVRMKIEFVENTQPGWSRSSVLYYISFLADEDLATVWQFAHELVRANRQKRGPAPPRTGP